MEILNQKQKIIAMAVIAVVFIVIAYYYINTTKDVYNNNEIGQIVETEEENEIEKSEEEKIIVHITGAVKNEGIVEVKEKARINDAIEAAGGVTENADLSQVNLAYMIGDGQKIYIPSKEKHEQEQKEEQEVVSEEAGGNVLEIGEEAISVTFININTATAEKLQQLPGIGTATANKIIEYRDKNGKFKTIEDIKNVSGIGNSKYEAIKDFIFV